MEDYIKYALGTIAAAALFALGYKSVEMSIGFMNRKIAERKKLRTGVRFVETDTWYAAWQTTVEGAPNINTELLRISQNTKNKVSLENVNISPENPKGGYLWKGTGVLHENERLIGEYVGSDPTVISKGCFYFTLNPSGTFMIGKWVGCNYDCNFTWGFGVIAKNRDLAIVELKKLIENNGPEEITK